MVKATAKSVAESNDAVDDEVTDTEAPTTKVIAEWIGDDRNPRMGKHSAREITKKQAKEGLLMELTRDLRWGPETAFRADVTAEGEPFQNWLRDAKEFKVTEE